MDELQRRIELAKSLQAKPVSSPIPRKTRKQSKSKWSRIAARIDRSVMPAKLRYFPQESRYAFPPNMGNARNPLIFGKIPLDYQIMEQIENEQVMLKARVRPNWPKVHGHLKTCPCKLCKP
jgi:hypothetical protein